MRHMFYIVDIVVKLAVLRCIASRERADSASMKRKSMKQTLADAFEMVRTVGLTLPDVEETTKYDGSPVLKLGGSFMAGLATHPSADPDTLIVRAGCEEREWLIEDAPETYYLTDYYRSYPLVLVRLSRIDRDALRDLLSVSWRMTSAKVRKRGRRDATVKAR
jgi:hypothetical protein